MTLSILIPSLACRKQYRDRLLNVLAPQVQNRPDVEILIHEDDGRVSIGEKRNDLVARASGSYCCAIDDDDLVAPDYIARIMAVLDQLPDCVGFRMKRYSDGKQLGEGINSLRCRAYVQRDMPLGMVFYERTPNHLNPIRTELVRRCPFPALNWAEDKAFALAVYPLLKSEVFIDRYLYEYLYRTPYARRDERVNVARVA